MIKFSKTVASAVALAIIVGISAVGIYRTQADQQTSFAYIDTVRIWNELPQMDEMRGILEEETKNKQAAYDKEAANLTDGDARVKLFEKYQSELDTRKDQLFQEVLDDTYILIEKVAGEQGIDLVLDKQGVLYGGLDLTDQVIAAAKAAN